MDFKGENKGTSCRKSLTIWWKVWQNVHMDHMDGRACVGPSLLFQLRIDCKESIAHLHVN